MRASKNERSAPSTMAPTGGDAAEAPGGLPGFDLGLYRPVGCNLSLPGGMDGPGHPCWSIISLMVNKGVWWWPCMQT